MSYKNLYTEASIRVRERMGSQATKNLNKNTSDDYRKFVKLTQTIPNWKTYLTEKQLEVVDLFLKVLNCAAVDSQMKLNEDTTYSRLFGSRSTKADRGALGALERAEKALNKIKKESKAKKAVQ